MSTSDMPAAQSERASQRFGYPPDGPFVSERHYQAQPSPVTTTGPVLWLRQNLFSSWLNAILTVGAVALLAWYLPGLFDWAVLKSVWNASSLSECRQIIAETHGEGVTGACWAVVNQRFDQLIYGFYPEPLRWRPNVAFVLLIAAVTPVLFQSVRPVMVAMGAVLAFKAVVALWVIANGGSLDVLWSPTTWVAIGVGALAFVWGERSATPWFIFTLFFPVVAYFLLWGGFVLTPVESSRFGGFLLTIVIGVTGIAGSLPLGILLALGRQSKLPILKMFCVGFIEFIRGVPLITLLFVASTLLNYFLPPGTSFDIILRVLIMVTLFASAYMAEVIRGGLAALPRGQYEAGDSLGLGYWQSMRLVVLPQALKISIPGIVNTFIGLFKDTTLVAIIGLLDPLGLTQPIRSDSDWNGIIWELYGFIALVFFIFCWGMSRYSLYLETRLRASDQR